jgi:hypothetical protein
MEDNDVLRYQVPTSQRTVKCALVHAYPEEPTDSRSVLIWGNAAASKLKAFGWQKKAMSLRTLWHWLEQLPWFAGLSWLRGNGFLGDQVLIRAIQCSSYLHQIEKNYVLLRGNLAATLCLDALIIDWSSHFTY